MTTCKTRALRPADLPDLLEMVRGLAAHHGDTALVTQEDLARDCLGEVPWVRVIVAEGQAGLAGYAGLCPLVQVQFGARGMDMHHLFVRANLRGQGVGRALIAASRDAARALGCRYMTVGTHPDNVVAGRVYVAAGFDPMAPPGPRFRIQL